jgi:hypothetical protein
VPKTTNFTFECAHQDVFNHEFLHDLRIALDQLSGFQDIYVAPPGAFGNPDYPACGQGDPDPHRWFPDPNDCNRDPDYAPFCGNCTATNDQTDSHILSVHWTPGTPLLANHCHDGLQDFGETGVDTGGDCIPGL